MSLELLNRRDDDVAWLALARSSNVSEEVARLLWARAKAESNQDPIKAERVFRRLLEDAVTIDKLARELEANGDGGLLDPGKWTRVLDLSGTLTQSRAEAPAATASAPANENTITDQMRRFAKSDVGRMIGAIDSGTMQQLIRMVDALVTIVEHERAAQEGKPLPSNIRAELEDKLGIDFGDVRVHDNSKAAAEASKHDAIAFARGKDVYFADGAYNPSSLEGKKLIAHEVTHVAQQRGGGRAQAGAMSAPGSAVEREADRVADAFGAGAARGSAAFRVQERAAAGTISRKGDAPAAGGDGDKKPTKWKPQLFNQALDLSEKLSLAKDIGGGHKEIDVNQNIGPLKIQKAQFKQSEAGDKIESGTLHANVDSGVFKGTTGQLKVDQNEGVSGKVNVPINATGMFAKEVNLEVGNGEITGKVRLDPSDFKSPHFTIKNSDFELSVTSKGGTDIGAQLIGTGQVAIENGFAQGLAQLDIDLKVHREQGVTFNARVAGKIAVAGLGEAGAEIFWDGSKLTFNAGGTAPINIPGLEGIANFKYELGKLSLSSDSVRFTLPKLRPVAFSGVELGGESKLKARMDLESPVLIPLPGGASIELEHSTITIDGKKVEGEITGNFALNNAGGFKGQVNVGIVAEQGKPIDLQVDTHVDMNKVVPQLKGDVHVIYQRGGGQNAFSFDATDIGVVPEPLHGQVVFSQMSGHLKGGELTGSLTAAAGTEINVGKTTKITILGGHIELLPGKILDGHIKARTESGSGTAAAGADSAEAGTAAEATIGWNHGTFDWAAEGNFELKDLTSGMLLGSVHAAAGSNGTGNFVSNGPITFGNPALKDVTIEHLTGNKEEGHYEATISVEKVINKVLSQVPSVKVEAAKAAAVVTYKDKKLSINGELGLKACYPATGEPQLEGTLFLGIDKDTGGFIGQLTGVNVKAGKYFESHGGHVDLKSGDVTLGTAKFEVPNVASGTVNHAQVNVKDKTFSIDLDVDLKAKALDGVKLTAHVDNDKITAGLREGTPPIALGTFATLQLTNGSNFEFSKEGGLVADVVATVDAPSVGTGTARLHYEKKLTGSAEVDVKQFAMFAPTKVHLNFDEQRKVSTVEPIKIELAEQYQTNFVANAEIVVDKNVFNVTGKVTELKNLGSVSEAFAAGGGAQIQYDSGTKRVTMDANIAVDKVVKQLGPGSTLHMAYADGVVNIDGVLKPGNIGGTQVVFSPTSQINAHWDSKTKHFTTVGGAQATIADLCDVDFTVDMALGGGQPGQFGLRGRIEAGKLMNKLPGISFSAVTADFSLLIAAGQKSDLDFNLRAGINGIPAAGINDVDGYLQANFKTGQGINGEFGINHAKLGPVIADGKISVERGKFKSGSLNMSADFPKLKIEGSGEVTAGEMGGLNTSANLKVTPSPETAIGKFVQSGQIHVDLVKWKVTNAVGELNLVPPSFLPLVDPKIVVSYKPEDGIKAALKTQFPAPMAKNGELGNFEAGYQQGKGLYAHVDFPIQVPGFQTATVTGDLDKDGVKIGVDLIPKNAGLVKQARVEVGYGKENGFYVEGKIRLKPTETLELEVGLRYDGKGLQVIGMEPDDKDANTEDHELAKKKFPFPTIPLLTVGVAQLGLKFGMEISAGYRMPKIKFKNPQLEGGLEALDSGGMPSFTFGGSIAMGAYVALALSVQVVGEIQLLICSASAGIGAEIMARLNLELGANVNGRYASGQGALITIDPYIAASLDLIASLIATLHAEIGWWTILDKKWTLASATFAHIDLGTFKPFKPIGLGFGGPGGTRLTTGMELNDGAFDSVTEGVKEGGKKSADNESNRETREKLTPVLQSFKNAAPQFAELPPGWEKGMVAAPVDFQSMFPVEDKKWDVYQDHADQAEDMVPELRMTTPTERLAKAVAVTARKNPMAAGRLILGWRRAQIAAKGINPDTGVDVVNERLIVQALIDAKYEKDVADAQEKQRLQDEEHAAHVVKQTSDFGKADAAHAQVAVQQQAAHDKNVTQIQTEWTKAQEKKAVAGKAAAQEGANVKPVQEQKAPPPPKPAAPPKPAPLAKPAPIPVPPKVPMPPPKEVLPAVTLPALPDDPGVSVKAAGVIPPQKKKVEPESPGKKEAPTGGVPNPQPGATAGSASQQGGGGGTPMGGKGDGNSGAGPQVGGTTSSVPPPGPRVVAGPDGIISQNKTIDTKHSKYDPSFKGAGGGGGGGFLSNLFGGGAKPAEAAPGGAAPGGKDGKAAPGAPGGDAASKDPKAPGKPGAAAGLDPTVQKVVDAGKAEETKQKQALDNQKKGYDDKVKQNNKKTEDETKKLDAAAAEAKKKKEQEKAAAAAAAQKQSDADALKKKGDGKDGDKKPKGPIGTRISIDILGQPHTLYIDEVTGVPMVEPPPTPLATKLAEVKAAIGSAPPSIKNNAASVESTTEALEQQLEAVAKKAAAGDASALAEVTSKEQAVANSLKVSWAWAEVAKEPAVTGGSIEKPLTHPYYPQFKARVQHLNDAGHLTVDVGPFAESIWIKICEAVKKASPNMNDPKAYSDFAKGWLNMLSPEFKKAMGELDHIGKELAKAGQSAFAKADSFGFWSKPEGRALAERVGGLTLETSAIGTLMDGLPTLDGKKAGWDPEIWGALSNAYATAVVPEVIKGKKIKVCIGAGVPPGNIWEAVESVALTHGLKQAGIELDHITTHYAAAALAKNNAQRGTLNDTKVTGGIKGCLFVGDRPGAIAAADAYWKTCPEEFIGPLKQEKPTIDPVANQAANKPAGANQPVGANQPAPANQPAANAEPVGTKDAKPEIKPVDVKLEKPFTIGSEAHTLYLENKAGDVKIDMASVKGSLESKFAGVDRLLALYSEYLAALDPVIAKEFDKDLAPLIKNLKTEALKAHTATVKGKGPKDAEVKVALAEAEKDAASLIGEIQSWCSARKLTTLDEADLKAEIERRADELQEQLLKQKQDEVQAKFEQMAGAVQGMHADARLKYRGSLAKGRKGAQKGFALFDPTAFDIDLFIQSDDLYKKALKAGAQERKPGEVSGMASKLPEIVALVQRTREIVKTIVGFKPSEIMKADILIRTVTNANNLKRDQVNNPGEKHETITPPPKTPGTGTATGGGPGNPPGGAPAGPSPASPAQSQPELTQTAEDPVVAKTSMDGAPHELIAKPETGKVEFNSIKGFAAEKLQSVVKHVPDEVLSTVTDALSIALDVASIVIEPALKPGAKPSDRPPIRKRLATRLENLASAIRVFGDKAKVTDADPSVVEQKKAKDAEAKAKIEAEKKAKEAEAKAKAEAEAKAKLEADAKAKEAADAQTKPKAPATQPPNAADAATQADPAAKKPDPTLKPDPKAADPKAVDPKAVDPNKPKDPKAADPKAAVQPPVPETKPADPAPIAALSAHYKEIGAGDVTLKVATPAGTVSANGADVTAHSDGRPAKEISDGIKAMCTKYFAEGTKDEERKELLAKIKVDLEALRKAMATARGEDSPVVQMRVKFEKNIGAKAYAETDGFAGASAAVTKMVTAALKIIAAEHQLAVPEAASADAIVKQMSTNDAIKKTFESELGYPTNIGYAGAVGKSFKAITDALVSGSLTQRCQHLINFGEDYIGKRILREVPAVMAIVRKSLTEVQSKALDAKIAAGKSKIDTPAEKKVAKGVMTDSDFQTKVDKHGAMDDKTPPVPVEALDRESLFRVAKLKNVEVEKHDTDAEIVAKLKAKGIKDSNAWMMTTPEQGPAKPEITKDGMPYLQGIEANLVLKQHPWITNANEAEMPLKAGISGTTHRFVALGTHLGVEDRPGMRLAMLGHLQAIEAHSFWEICDAVGKEPKAGTYLPFDPVSPASMEAAAKETIGKEAGLADKLGPKDLTAQVARLLGTVASDDKKA